MKKVLRVAWTMGRRLVGYGLVGAVIALVVSVIVALEKRADLGIWHEVELDQEFTSDSGVEDFEGYLELEDRLFEQLDREVYAKTSAGSGKTINRYVRGNRADPEGWERNWNRTFEFTAENPKAGVLLLHGMSDSPYSLRHFGEGLHAGGVTVIGLRIPGHGTAPSGLVRVKWQDMAAAVKLAARQLRESVGEAPVYLVGYSNGGALAVEYTLETLEDPELPRVAGVVLLSPEIGVSKVAALAVWQGRLGRWLGLDKLAWNDISLEYDPFKYGSFAINAGDQAYRLTLEIDGRLDALSKAGGLGEFPPVLAFQSAVDATVSAPALVKRLFDRLPEGGHELVLFDINRRAGVDHFLAKDPVDEFGGLLANQERAYTLSVVSNRRSGGELQPEVEIRRYRPGGAAVETIDPGVAWPKGLYSLSHIALPFPEGDPLYGSGEGGKEVTLGNLALRGERGVIRISPGNMLRQRWNPFYPWMEGRVLEFIPTAREGS